MTNSGSTHKGGSSSISTAHKTINMAGSVEVDSLDDFDDVSLVNSENDSKNYQDSSRDFQSEMESGGSNTGLPPSDREEIAKLALQETRNVRVWRRNVLLMILLLGATVTTLTFILLRNEDQEDFSTSVCIQLW